MSRSCLVAVALISVMSLAGQTSDVKTAATIPVPLTVTILGSGGGPSRISRPGSCQPHALAVIGSDNVGHQYC